MARIRTVKPELFRHEALFEAEQKSGLPLRLAYIGIFTACDREGRFKWKPRALKLDVIPYDDVDFSRVLDALVTYGFIVKYEFEGNQFGCIPSWNTHQVINNRESTSILPSLEESTVCTRDPHVKHASTTPLMHAQGEWKGKEGNRKGNKEGAIVTRPEFVDEQIWNDWLVIRKKKNAPLTQTAWNLMTNEVQKSGWSIDKAIEECCLRTWASFKAEWVADKQAANRTVSFAQQERELGWKRWEEMTGREHPDRLAHEGKRPNQFIDIQATDILEIGK
jgi:hypothetical protein